jgi:flagellar biosynthesis component FlhA
MGDAGEGLIDAEARIQERMEDVERERARKNNKTMGDPERIRALESLKLARTELGRQLSATAHEGRRAQLTDAIKEVDRRIAAAAALLAS